MTVNRSRIWAGALLAAVFVAGVAVGWAGKSWPSRGQPSHKQRGTDAWVAYLTRELDLTPAQRDSVRTVYERRRTASGALWQEVRPPFDSLRSAMQAEITALLDPARRARYRQLLAEREQRKKQGSADTGKRN